MTDAKSRTAVPRYTREKHTADMPIEQKSDIDLGLEQTLVHGEGLANVAGSLSDPHGLAAELAFNEEPVTIRLEENSRSDFPETHVPAGVNGRGAEIWLDGKWVAAQWLPVNMPITVKRKYVEVLLRSKSDNIRTKHEDANVEKPQNRVERRTTSNYPMSIIEDKNPRGANWASRIMQGY